jgi:hypothetical protein
MRTMAFSRVGSDIESLFSRMGCHTFRDRLRSNSLKYIYKSINNMSSFVSIGFFKSKQNTRSRHSDEKTRIAANKIKLFNEYDFLQRSQTL